MPHLAEPTAAQPVESAMVPRLFRLVDRRQDTADTFTLMLEPNDGVPLAFIPGQFTMLSAFGVGEVPISVSGDAHVAGPLQHTVRGVLAQRQDYGRVVLLYGGRSPEELLCVDELKQWEDQGMEVLVTVDYGRESWQGRVGLVTKLIPRAGFDPMSTLALICGPEVMMRNTALALVGRGVRASRIRVSLERNMRCGVG